MYIFSSANSSGSLPRGIVTATTVPKGSSFTSSPLPSTLQQQLQQTKHSQAPAQSTAKSIPQKSSKTKATPLQSEGGTPSVPNCSSNAPTTLESPETQDKPTTDCSSSALSQTTVVSTASLSSSSSVLSPEVAAPNFASQLMDAHSLLQQQGAGSSTSPSRVANSTLPLIPQELLAQVSSFLNLPSQTTPLSESAAGVSVSKEINSGSSEPTTLGKILFLF